MNKSGFTIRTIMFIMSVGLLITGCSKKTQDNVQEPQKETMITPTLSPLAIPTEEASYYKEYLDVLNNKKEFYSTDDMKNRYLKDLLSYQGAGFDSEFQLSRFTVIDMDGDDINEVILELSFLGSESIDFYEVLHEIDGTVYGYLIPYRGLQNIKEDGTFLYSNGAMDNGYSTIKFTKEHYEDQILGFSEFDGDSVKYYLDNSPSTKEEFLAYSEEQEKKTEPEWYEFSTENFETVLSEK